MIPFPRPTVPVAVLPLLLALAGAPAVAETNRSGVLPQPVPPAAVPPPDVPQETQAPALSPGEALARFQVAGDLEWELVLAEPQIAQPVFLNFDERGRLWVVEFRQYPWPAGLRMVSRDSVWRAVYDRVPPPPPRHVRGADRITIHEDADGDGRFERHKVFLDGLNIATAVERGRGGVWVLNPPYLLFYPDADRDDVPDGDPEVRLSGFGLEDTHSVANSLRWGPDGWLYGAQGSTVTANIQVAGPEGKPLNPRPIYSQGQNIWRYHPGRRVYEVFAEGGGNAFGLEMDNQGRIFSGHNGGDTRGFHYIQGAYLQKGFEKHGPLSNPHAYGYFPAMAHGREPRFTHNFILYDHGALPAAYQGRLFGVEPLQGRIVLSELRPDGSTFRTRDLSRPVTSADRWFRPVDIKAGPDGAIYVCDWYDRQVNHYRNHEGQIDTDRGRIYRLKGRGTQAERPGDLARLSSARLLELLRHPNRWMRQTALRLLGDRRDATLRPALAAALPRLTGQAALETLWALHLVDGLTEVEAGRALAHADPFVRLWTVRLLGDGPAVPAPLAGQLAAHAAGEPHLEVRNQLAATAKRLPAPQGLALVAALARRAEDATDNRMPLLLWWAIEAHCGRQADEVLRLFEDRALWSSPLVERHLLERVARRFAQAGTRADLLACARLLTLAPSVESSRRLVAGFEAGFKGRPLAGLPDELVQALARQGVASAALALRQGDLAAVNRALRVVADGTAPRAERLEFLGVMSEVRVPGALPALARAYRGVDKDETLRRAVLAALQNQDEPEVADLVLETYAALGRESALTALTLLASRPAWALKLARAIPGGPVSTPEAVPPNIVRKLRQYRDPELAALVRARWPSAGRPTPADLEAKMQRLAAVVRSGTGDAYLGRTLFQKTCASCHTLFGQGADGGPDLTVFERTDLESMLLAMVNPGAEIREGFESYSVETKDGRSLAGCLVEQDARTVVLRGLDNRNLTLARADLEEFKADGGSLMPEGLLDGFSDEEVRALFAYLRSTQPLVGEPPRSAGRR